jgi:hypothetical protein
MSLAIAKAGAANVWPDDDTLISKHVATKSLNLISVNNQFVV